MADISYIDRNISMYGEIDNEMALRVASAIKQINKYDDALEEQQLSVLEDFVAQGIISREGIQGLLPREPITLDINSGGGMAPAGLSMVSAIENSVTPIIGYVTGNCMSMAIVILASCHYRMSTEYANFMIHDVFGGAQGKFNDMKSSMQHIEQVRDGYKKLIVKYTKVSRESIDEISDANADYFFTPTEAKTLGLIDAVDTDDIDENEFTNKLYGIELPEGEDDDSQLELKLDEVEKSADTDVAKLVEDLAERVDAMDSSKTKKSKLELLFSSLVGRG